MGSVAFPFSLAHCWGPAWAVREATSYVHVGHALFQEEMELCGREETLRGGHGGMRQGDRVLGVRRLDRLWVEGEGSEACLVRGRDHVRLGG